ncbi:predicted protein [Chaetoceros tenuissimus]|uniref:Ubiquitin-like domain-containing protein n=1 Tax=Chaetoceros tenuissimus TaxID=426638 RepID=A0AAD3H732_9STRA|nr:predicted protein [Chaetoceros tenuissimus]
MSATKNQTTLTSVANELLLQENDLDFLKEDYEHKTGMSVSFEDCKRHYIEYLLALIAAHSLLAIDNSLQLSPPLHVDMLWHSHILETRRYREFEKMVLEAYNKSGRKSDLQHLDHSVVDNKVGREERIKKTKGFYQLLGFTFVNSVEEAQKQDEDSSVQFQEVISNTKESDISLLSNSNHSSASSTASSQLVEDHKVDSKEDADNVDSNKNGLVVTDALKASSIKSTPVKNQTMKEIEITVPPGPLGLNLGNDKRGVVVRTKTGEQTKLLPEDIILSVDNEPVKTANECADACLKHKDKYRTLLIKRKVSEESSSDSKSEQQVKEHPATSKSKRAHEDTEDDCNQKKKSKVAVSKENKVSSSVSPEEESSSQNRTEKADKSLQDTSKAKIYNIQIKGLDSTMLHFKAKGSIKFRKLTNEYMKRKNINSVRLIWAGRQIAYDDERSLGNLFGNKLDITLHCVLHLKGC